jgi:formylglycine-generating enzyme required for sulfatase activity
MATVLFPAPDDPERHPSLGDLVKVVAWKTLRLRKYLQYLIDRYQFLELRGMGVHDRVALQLPLLDLYVPLKARRQLPRGETWSREARLAGRKGEQAPELDATIGQPEPIVDLLRKHSGVILLGDPGAGKTTFLKWLALQLARPDDAGEAELGIGTRFPILVPLSAYARSLARGARANLDAFITRYFDDLGLDSSFVNLAHEALRAGRALAMFDGLDEVQQDALRRSVVDGVVSFFAAHSRAGNKFVLTSRIVGYANVRPTVDGLAECTLIDFEDKEIAAFTEKWTTVLERTARGATQTAAHEAAREREDLLSAIRRNPGTRALAANPLLLTILALMKRQGVELPERRVELYDTYVKVLLKHWNLARGLDRPPARDLDVSETLKVLAPLALWMHEESAGVGLVAQGALQRRLQQIYADRRTRAPDRAAERLLADVREYAGLLLERGPRQYGFIHLTLQEFLAGVAVADLAQKGADAVTAWIAAHIDAPTWREVILLALGNLAVVQRWSKPAERVITAVIHGAPGKPGEALALMGEAVADMAGAGVSDGCRDDLRGHLLRAMRDDVRVERRDRAACGDVLARLGDPRFRPDAWFLPDDEMLGFIRIRDGSFLMGTDDKEAHLDEQPQHTVTLPAYYIARWPVTVAQFRAFVDAPGNGGFTPCHRRCLSGLPNHPVTNVDWHDVLAYCRWLTEQLRVWRETPERLATLLRGGDGQQPWCVTLPSEAEWEKAARGTEGRLYPWGNDPPDAWRAPFADTMAVGCFPAGVTEEGVEELSSNVYEWTRSASNQYYPYNPADGREGVTSRDRYRVLRGDAFGRNPFGNPRRMRADSRRENDPTLWNFLGFRLAVSPFTSAL